MYICIHNTYNTMLSILSLLLGTTTLQTCSDVTNLYRSEDVTTSGSCCDREQHALATKVDLLPSQRVTAVVHLRFPVPLSQSTDPEWVQNITKLVEFMPAAAVATGGANAPKSTFALTDQGVFEFYKYDKPEHHHEFVLNALLPGAYFAKAQELAGLPADFDKKWVTESITIMSPDVANAQAWYEEGSKGVIPTLPFISGSGPDMSLSGFLQALFGSGYYGIKQGQ